MNKTAKRIYTSMTVHDLPPDERPRERLQKVGADALSTQELLALILGRGIAGESVLITAQRLLRNFSSLQGLSEASLEEMAKVRGIGLAKAAQIKAAFELARRSVNYSRKNGRTVIKMPEDAFNLAFPRLRGRKQEHFLAILLDIRSQLIKLAPVSVGSLEGSVVHPREVYKEAISASAASIVFVHNHPSGNPEPSDDDVALTRRLSEVGSIMGIEVLDHIIIGDGVFTSLKREGLF